YIVDAKGKVEVRNVTLGWIVEGRWVVVKGLATDDRVVVEGFQKIAPGTSVKAEPWPGIASTSSAAKKEG
ncbi:efflux transporter periplasmic adaptor subunit, partial [Rhizobium sp. L245/93]|nr:efflux transporter periplasmic adaptor subunit [Rhizobium sp. L58/93]MBO9170484.1 efflux transporter periplasmic adaptor subunit [Rhizobium sp. L245/93]